MIVKVSLVSAKLEDISKSAGQNICASADSRPGRKIHRDPLSLCALLQFNIEFLMLDLLVHIKSSDLA